MMTTDDWEHRVAALWDSLDELADAVKQDNQQDIKFGASVTASYAGVTASSNFDMNNTQKQARETSHKHMREQSSKLSTEIKTSYKTTFRTVTGSMSSEPNTSLSASAGRNAVNAPSTRRATIAR